MKIDGISNFRLSWGCAFWIGLLAGASELAHSIGAVGFTVFGS